MIMYQYIIYKYNNIYFIISRRSRSQNENKYKISCSYHNIFLYTYYLYIIYLIFIYDSFKRYFSMRYRNNKFFLYDPFTRKSILKSGLFFSSCTACSYYKHIFLYAFMQYIKPLKNHFLYIK